MKNGFLCAVLVVLALGAALSAHADDSYNEHDSRELIVLLGHGQDFPKAEGVVEATNLKATLPENLDVGNPVKARVLISRRITGAQLAQLNETPDVPQARLQRYIVLTYPTPVDLDAIKFSLEKNRFVINVGKNVGSGFSADPPTDPFVPYQWAWWNGTETLRTMNLPSAWLYTKGHAYVGIVDTGIQVDHEDLKPTWSSNEYKGGNFRSQFSYNYFSDPPDSDAGESGTTRGHGTHVSGIIGATPNNGTGVAGACANCSLMIGKITSDPSIDIDAAALTGLVDMGAQIINRSGFISTTQNCPEGPAISSYCDALAYAASRDVTMFAASGNFYSDTIDFPARDGGVIAVGGIWSDNIF